ncbi:hypothetical protein D0C36_19440 [Mucilaginibacter conchicola]|uniref:Uncharacterized protein n=1 Tax=Mucilaginibacter conchicola TaxID=2303333 RepID=A0A372NR87_9SPHI|nr:hypothetical protein [Mucilaginibacter conchicola]RFZ91117.1 hypothetical protein D0C36_19440 [Mucilaginibacter conchicola]
MNPKLIPTKPGQICKIVSTIADLEPEEVYIVTENPEDFDNDEEILVVSLTELQRNVSDTNQASRTSVKKSGLVVVGENLQEYVRSWNEK